VDNRITTIITTTNDNDDGDQKDNNNDADIDDDEINKTLSVRRHASVSEVPRTITLLSGRIEALVSAYVRTFRTFLLIRTFSDIFNYVRTSRHFRIPVGLENPFRKNYYFLMDYDMSKTIMVSEISTIMGKLFRSFLGQIG
jgi:hypothetical protein